MTAAPPWTGVTVLQAVTRPETLFRWAWRPAPRRWWVVVTATLPPLIMIAAWLTAAALQPPGYSPVRQTVSALAAQGATDPWIVTASLYVASGCLALTALGLTELALPPRIGLLVAAASAAGIAANPQPAHGSSAQHVAWTVLGALTITLWPALLAPRKAGRPAGQSPPSWPAYIVSRRARMIFTLVDVALLAWLFGETQGGSVLGLAERLSSTAQLCWPSVAAVALLRAGADREAPAAAKLPVRLSR